MLFDHVGLPHMHVYMDSEFNYIYCSKTIVLHVIISIDFNNQISIWRIIFMQHVVEGRRKWFKILMLYIPYMKSSIFMPKMI